MYNLIRNGNYNIAVTMEDDKRLALRLSEDPDMELIPKYPELVDIKLTNVCHIGCAWCYQDSVSDSVHGSLESIKIVLDSLPPWTEVAFGGGDVLMHPNIVEILKYARERGLSSSNVTMNWQSIMRYPEHVKSVIPLLDAIGCSITGVKQVEQVVKQLKSLNCYNESRICYHVIPDLYSKRMLFKILKEIKEHAPKSDVLFLGYKTVGRGKLISVERKNEMNEILQFIIDNKLNLQCDTKFVKDYYELVSEISSKLTYDIHEGEFSMNIDCVENFCSQSSYNLDLKIPINESFSIVEAFKQVRKFGGLTPYTNGGI